MKKKKIRKNIATFLYLLCLLLVPVLMRVSHLLVITKINLRPAGPAAIQNNKIK